MRLKGRAAPNLKAFIKIQTSHYTAEHGEKAREKNQQAG